MKNIFFVGFICALICAADQWYHRTHPNSFGRILIQKPGFSKSNDSIENVFSKDANKIQKKPEIIRNQFTQLVESYSYQISEFCLQNVKVCESYLTDNLENIFNWEMKKVIFVMENIFANGNIKPEILENFISRPINLDEFAEDDHHSVTIDDLFLVKSIALNEYMNSLNPANITPAEKRKLTMILENIALSEIDLALVRDSLIYLKLKFKYTASDIIAIIGNRGQEDRFAYQDLLKN